MNSQSLKMVFDNSIRPNPVCGVARQSRSIQERLRTLECVFILIQKITVDKVVGL